MSERRRRIVQKGTRTDHELEEESWRKVPCLWRGGADRGGVEVGLPERRKVGSDTY